MSLIQEPGKIPSPGQRVERKYYLDLELLQAVQDISMQFSCSEGAVVETLLRFAVAQTRAFVDYTRLWDNLSRREKEVIALACLDHTNQQIALHLGISPETVKTHLYNALGKLHIRGRKDLTRALGIWDFSDWRL